MVTLYASSFLKTAPLTISSWIGDGVGANLE